MRMTPYEEYKISEYWKLIDEIFAELEGNNDIDITTQRDHVIGSIVKEIVTFQKQGKGNG